MGTNIQDSDTFVDADFFIEKRRKWISHGRNTSESDGGGCPSSKDNKSIDDLKSTGFANDRISKVSSLTCDSSSSPLSHNTTSSKQSCRLGSPRKSNNNSMKYSPATLSPDTTVPDYIFKKKITSSSDFKISDDTVEAIKDKKNSPMLRKLDMDDDTLTRSRIRSEVYLVSSLDSNLRKEGKSVKSRSEKYSKTRRKDVNSMKLCKCKVAKKLEDLRKNILEIKRSSSESSASSSLSSSSSSYSSSSSISSSSRDYNILSKLIRIPKSYQKYCNRPDGYLSSESSHQRHRSKSTKVSKCRTHQFDHESDYDVSDIDAKSPSRYRSANCANCYHCYRHLVDRKRLHTGNETAIPPTSKPYPPWNSDCKVYIGGLDESTTRKEIRNIFLKYGRITNLWIAKKPPGFAFVEYAKAEDAKVAVRKADGMTIINGNRIKVQKSKTRSDSRHNHRSLPHLPALRMKD
ncbi:uncharacterized protein [Palaemon carinicauda]|uniref:uncharacterized protein n=1 Tax=Palaemon carinicauda TaxID=392227 RepID=UPI0035B67925